jgi:hypothetical protein
MAPLGFLRFVTVVSLAVLQASFDALPVNALAVEHGHLGRGLSHAHADIAKKRDSPSSKKCRPRPTTSPKPAADNVPAPSTPSHSTQPASTTTSSQPPPANTPSSSGGGGKSFLAWSNNEQGSLEHFVSNNPACVHSFILSGSFLTPRVGSTTGTLRNIPRTILAHLLRYLKLWISSPPFTAGLRFPRSQVL